MMMALVGSDCVTYSTLSSGDSATPFGRYSSFSMTVTLPSVAIAVHAVERDLLLRRLVELLEAVRRIGEEQHAALHARHVVGARELLAVEQSSRPASSSSSRGRASGCARLPVSASRMLFCVEDREAVGAGLAPDVRVGLRGAGRIEEFLEAAFLRPLPHLVAGHVGEQQVAAGLHPDRALGPAEAFRELLDLPVLRERWRPSRDPSDRCVPPRFSSARRARQARAAQVAARVGQQRPAPQPRLTSFLMKFPFV